MGRCAEHLIAEGLDNIPSWEQVLQGTAVAPRGDADEERDPGEWRRQGWQRFACAKLEEKARDELLRAASPGLRACMRSGAGPNTSRWLTAIPQEADLRLPDNVFRFVCLRRIGLPVNPAADACEGCGAVLDRHGHHRTTCMRTGRVHARRRALLQAWIRVLREAGVTVRTSGRNRHVERLMRNTHIHRAGGDARRMDIVLPGMDGVFGGAPLFIDATCISLVRGDGYP